MALRRHLDVDVEVSEGAVPLGCHARGPVPYSADADDVHHVARLRANAKVLYPGLIYFLHRCFLEREREHDREGSKGVCKKKNDTSVNQSIN